MIKVTDFHPFITMIKSCRFHSYDKTTEILIRITVGFTGRRLEIKHRKMQYLSGCSTIRYFMNFAESRVHFSLQTRINVTPCNATDEKEICILLVIQQCITTEGINFMYLTIT
jgi:hypothetical protein